MAANKRRSSKGGGGSSSSSSSSKASTSSSSSSSDNNGSKKKSSISFFGWGNRKRHPYHHHDKKLGHLTTSTIQAAGVLVLAIVTALVWNNNSSSSSTFYKNNDPADPVVAAFLHQFCNFNAAAESGNNNRTTTTTTSTTTTTFCHSFLVPSTRRRTLKAMRDVFPRQRVVQIPRALMIFDLDALRNPWIRREFFDKPQLLVQLSASSLQQQQQQQHDNSSTTSLLDADAFLAVHLALLQQQQESHDAATADENSSSSSNSSSASSSSSSASSSSLHHPLLLDYVRNVMPSYQHLEEHHPLLWPDDVVRQVLGGVYTSTYQVVRLFRQSVQNEYQILSSASNAFARKVSWQHYVRARLCVMTRSFGTGPLLHSQEQQEAEANDDDDGTAEAGTTAAASRMTLAEEFALYREKLGLHIEHGSHALVPVLDLLNHHATPNVGYVYDTVKRAFVITSLGSTIPAGHEVFDSYGKHTDVHLFARYGFVSADGSEHSQSNLAIWHDVYEADVDLISHNYMNPDRVVARSRRMLRYLQFDDGYHECITVTANNNSNHHDAYRLKMLKFIKLSQMAHTPSSFTFILGPSNKHATTPRSSSSSSHSIIRLSDLADHKPGDAPFDGNAIFATCRLLVLTHRDYNGSATQMLQHNLYNDTYMLPNLMATRDALEFRTVLCVTRLAREALRRFNVTVQQQKELVVSLSSSTATAEQAGSRRAWMAAHLRLSEMQNLEFLIKVAFGALQNFPHSNDMNLLNSEEDYWMRDEPCPAEIAIDPYMQHLNPPPTVIGGDSEDDDDDQKNQP